MSESPDFEKIARRLIVLVDPDGAEEDERPIDDLHRQAIANQLAAVVEQVRQLWNARAEEASRAVSQAYELGHTAGWNARGAADLAKLDATVTYTTSGRVEGSRNQIDHALRSLDR